MKSHSWAKFYLMVFLAWNFTRFASKFGLTYLNIESEFFSCYCGILNIVLMCGLYFMIVCMRCVNIICFVTMCMHNTTIKLLGSKAI